MAAASGPNVVEDGLVLALDAGNTESYDNPTITYVGGTSDSDNSSSFTLSGLQSGDLVLYFSAEDAAAVNTPTGASWTAIPGLSTQPDNDANPHSAAFYVFATGTSVTASGLATGNNHVRVMIAFRNVNSTNPFDVNATENSGSGLPDPPSITPVTDNSMIVAAGLLDDHDIANSISPPTGYTTAVNMDSQGGVNDTGLGGATIMTAYKLLATAAAEDPGGFTGTTGDPQKGISIALRPATSLTWTDLIGNNSGTLTNGPTHSSNSGGYFEFTNSNSYIQLSSPVLTTPSTYSVDMWVKMTDTTEDSIFLSNRDANHDGFELRFNGDDENPNNWVQQINGVASSTSEATVNQDQWYHVAFHYDGNYGKTFVNGVQIDNGVFGSQTLNMTTASTIGAKSYQTSDVQNTFEIGALRVYNNKALTAAEVLQNFNALKGRYGY